MYLVLEMLCLKKLKIILLYSFIIITFFNTFYIVKNKIVKTNYKEGNIILDGVITKIEKTDNYLKLLINSKEKILVNYYSDDLNNFEKLKLGNKVTIKGELQLPKTNTNFYLFNYKNYLLSKKINFVLNADKIIVINDDISNLYKIKNKIINRINKSPNKIYLNLFILGNNELDDDIKNSYQINGISHLFAISGMHITFLTTFILFILNKIKLSKKINFIIITLFLLFYMFLTDYSASVLRASLFFIVLNIKKIFSLEISVLKLFILLLCLFLIYNPYYIYDVGFLFSFLISGTLICFSGLLEKQKTYLKKLFMSSLISFLIGIPIMIKYFHQINLLTPLVNLLFIPLVSLIVFPLALLTFIFPFINPILTLFIFILEMFSKFISEIDLFVLILNDCSFLILFIYMLMTFIIFKTQKFKNLIVFFIMLLIHNNINYLNSNVYVTVLDVGQGDSLLIRLPYNKGNILIDTGGIINYKTNENTNITDNILIPYFKAEGISKIDLLILTHGDYDHMGEAINLVENFKVEKVIFNCGEFNELEQDLIKVLDKKKIPYYSCIKELNISDNILYFLNNNNYGNENDNSSVIYTSLNNYKFLFMGDAGIEVEEDLIKIGRAHV